MSHGSRERAPDDKLRDMRVGGTSMKRGRVFRRYHFLTVNALFTLANREQSISNDASDAWI
jgi:hypothetical protein